MALGRDPATLGAPRHKRRKRDFYPTEAPCSGALLAGLGDYRGRIDDLDAWEPFCGDGAISQVIGPHVRSLISTDIWRYQGFDPDALLDFRTATLAGLAKAGLGAPNAILTNPPYGRAAEAMAIRAVELMETPRGLVAFLCRLDWNQAPRRAPLFDHPAYAAKIVLRWRPRWIEGTTGAPRFPYAWFVWDWRKAPEARPVELFQARPRGV